MTEISDLRAVPHFFDQVADRIWNAWWKDGGTPLSHIETRLRSHLPENSVPTTLVAHDCNTFLGTASLVESDLGERTEFSPWVAAVWVEEAARRRGIGARLIAAAEALGHAAGHTDIYLCAEPPKWNFYESLGWTRIEENVGATRLGIFTRARV